MILLAVYFIFILYYREYRHKANLSNFLFEFKTDHKVAETTCNINNASGPGTANEHTVQWWFKKFCRGDESLEDEDSDQLSEVDNNQENHQS